MEVDSIKQKLFSAEVKLYQAENQASYLQSLANQMDQWVQITSVQRRDWSNYHPLAKLSILGGGDDSASCSLVAWAISQQFWLSTLAMIRKFFIRFQFYWKILDEYLLNG